jgi:hypothetical protein
MNGGLIQLCHDVLAQHGIATLTGWMPQRLGATHMNCRNECRFVGLGKRGYCSRHRNVNHHAVRDRRDLDSPFVCGLLPRVLGRECQAALPAKLIVAAQLGYPGAKQIRVDSVLHRRARNRYA